MKKTICTHDNDNKEKKEQSLGGKRGKLLRKKYKTIPTVLSKRLKFFNMNFIRLIKLRFVTRSSEEFMQISHLKGSILKGVLI